MDYDQAAALAEKLVQDGCDGLVVTGTTGETSTLTDDENLGMFRAVKEAVGGKAAIIAGTGTNDTAHSVHLSQRAAELGVDGLLIVTPVLQQAQPGRRRAHFETIASATDLPVMLYDIPGRSSIAIAPETMIALAKHQNIVAVKDAKADFAAATRVMAETDLLFYSGDDGLTLQWMALAPSAWWALPPTSQHAASVSLSTPSTPATSPRQGPSTLNWNPSFAQP